MEYLKNNYLILAIKCLILFHFMWTVYDGMNYLYSRWYFEIVTLDANTLFQNNGFLYSLKKSFSPSYLLLLPTIGIFINKQIGWFLITSFLYFMISSSAFLLIGSSLLDTRDVAVGLTIVTFYVLIVLVMNKEKIYNGTYNIQKNNLLIKNIIASIIGMGTAILVAYWKQ